MLSEAHLRATEGHAISDQGSEWIEYTTPDGSAGRVAIQQVEMITKRPDGDRGTIHTVSGEVISVVNAATVFSRWRALATGSQ